MIEVRGIIRRKKLTPAGAAKLFGVDKTVLTRLKHADMDFFTMDLLIKMLERAGKKVLVTVADKKRTHAA